MQGNKDRDLPLTSVSDLPPRVVQELNDAADKVHHDVFIFALGHEEEEKALEREDAGVKKELNAADKKRAAASKLQQNERAARILQEE